MGSLHADYFSRVKKHMQPLPEGAFNYTTLQWEFHQRMVGRTSVEVEVAFIPFCRVEDFIEGESTRADGQCHFVRRKGDVNPPGSLRLPRSNSYAETGRYFCEYGPQDFSHLSVDVKRAVKSKPNVRELKDRMRLAGVLAKAKGKVAKGKEKIACFKNWQNPQGNHKGPRTGKRMSGKSIKRGCRCSFSIKQFYLDTELVEITYHEKMHVNEIGEWCHGATHVKTRRAHAAHVSNTMKEWVMSELRLGFSVSQIMQHHKRRVYETMKSNTELKRDMLLTSQDVVNLSNKHARETYKKHSIDAESVKLWATEHPNNVFYYQPMTPTNDWDLPFTIGIQTEFQQGMMLRYGQAGAIALDATFGSNENKFPLYTLMVFDEWQNGIPVGYIITGRCREVDLKPWLEALKNKMVGLMPTWSPNAFIVDDATAEINAISVVFAEVHVFLCLWHVRRAWAKNAYSLIKDPIVRQAILQGMGRIMYDRACPQGDAAGGWAITEIFTLSKKYPTTARFFDYIQTNWLSNTEMWVTGARIIAYAGQDTNAAIENYHGNLKATLRASKSRLAGRRVDWLIWNITGPVLEHYWYHTLLKQQSYVTNKKVEGIVSNSLLLARLIPDMHVQLPVVQNGPAHVRSQSKLGVVYTMHGPDSDWACCDCVWSQKGYLCKHQIKVLQLLHPEVPDVDIVSLCGTLHGTIHGGVHRVRTWAEDRASTSAGFVTPPRTSGSTFSSDFRNEDILTAIAVAMEELWFGIQCSPSLQHHALASVRQALGKHKTLKARFDRSCVHPTEREVVFGTYTLQTPFTPLQRHEPMTLKRRLSFVDNFMAKH